MAFSGMTGFARADGRDGAWSWTVEARSVNGRSLEVRFRGPPGLESLERAAREAVQARMSRGQVSMGLKAKRERVGAELPVNEEALERLRLPGVRAGSQEEEVPEAAEAAMARSIVLETEEEALHAVRADVTEELDRRLSGKRPGA